jgi:hypothetical protein
MNHRRKRLQIQREDIEAIDEEDDEVEEAVEDALPTTSKQEMIELCRTLEKASIFHEVQGSLEVSEVLRRYPTELQKVVDGNKRRVTLDAFLSQK